MPLSLILFFLPLPRHSRSTLFPYTTLFRSPGVEQDLKPDPHQDREHGGNDLEHVGQPVPREGHREDEDRKSTRLNSSHVAISYAVFCLKKKNKIERRQLHQHNINNNNKCEI